MDSSSPVLSILIPVYNECKTVRRVLEKVRAVDFPVPIEIIAVNDGSTDGSREALQSLPPLRGSSSRTTIRPPVTCP